jgi:hypothetical protein
MTTKAPTVLLKAADAWENEYASAVFAGIVGDLAHRINGGYHISLQDQPPDNYSATRPKDKAPPGKWPRDMASAIDMSKNKADMVRGYAYWNQLYNDRTDPRRKYFNAVNCWDGSGDAVRLDFVANTRSFATADHQQHEHAEFCRMYVESEEAGRALVSVVSGETKAQWGEDDMEYPKFGDKGEPVKNLQYDLADTGDFTGTVDGVYGAATEAAVLKFRKRFLKPENVGGGKSVTGWMVHKLAREINKIDAKGPKGDPGPKGEKGDKGDPGDAAVIEAGSELKVVTTP